MVKVSTLPLVVFKVPIVPCLWNPFAGEVGDWEGGKVIMRDYLCSGNAVDDDVEAGAVEQAEARIIIIKTVNINNPYRRKCLLLIDMIILLHFIPKMECGNKLLSLNNTGELLICC